MPATIHCARCGQDRPRQPFRTFQTELGQRVFDTICADCWAEWLKHQQALINHYGLNLRDAKAREFLLQQMEQFLFTSEARS